MEEILFLDIETVPAVECLEEMGEEMQALWEAKFNTLKTKGLVSNQDEDYTAEEAYFEHSSVYAEFAKIICISVGFIYKKDGENKLRIKSFYGDDESRLLEEFSELIRKFMKSPYHKVCGHNLKEFDMPFISRRMVVNGLKIPNSINAMGKKPWETNFLDTMEMWKFGDFKSYTSLKTLTALFGIPSPKDDIDGSEVAGVYYHQGDLERIATYCQKDVLATVQVYLRLNGLPLIEESNLEISR